MRRCRTPDDKGGDLGEPYQGVHIVSWQWSRSTHEADPHRPFVDIPDATTNRYTAKNSDRGYYLRATATYTDPHSERRFNHDRGERTNAYPQLVSLPR